jgi:signal transduction histidine kinase
MDALEGLPKQQASADERGAEDVHLMDTGRIWGLSTALESQRADAAGRRADDAEARLRDQALLFAEAEHKLKTSLGVVAGWARTLDDRWDELSVEQRRYAVTTIRRTTDDLWVHCDAMLEELRTDVSILDLEPVRVDLDAILAVATMGYAGAATAHRIVHHPAKPVWAWVDPASLQQVIGHLLDNAVKYSPAGTTITVSAHSAGDVAELLVSDQGIGLPSGVDVFAPFVRGRVQAADHETEPGGVGLGLYIVRKLVEAMHGSVLATPNRDGGSTFTVCLPGGRLRRKSDADFSGTD